MPLPHLSPTLDDEHTSGLISRNIAVAGHRTSVRLEPEVWDALKDISRRENCTINILCTLIAARKRANTTLTAAIRVFTMLYYRAASTEDGHARVGHGTITCRASRLTPGNDRQKN
jgi:predicted DNA-binding ribbon-helix-helix protein